MQQRVARREIYLLLGTIVLAALTALILLARPISGRVAKPRPNNLELRVAEQDKKIIIDWQKHDPLIQNATGATLEVNDGGVSHRFPLESGQLRTGGLSYIRISEDVLMRITVNQDRAAGAQASVLRISPVNFSVAAAPPSPARSKPQGASGSTRARRR